jgi:hypothetical protein
MRRIVVAVVTGLLVAETAGAQGIRYTRPSVGVNGFRNGYYSTRPNGTRLDNWSTQGNRNPMTGTRGTKPVYPMPTWGNGMGGYGLR